MSDRGGIPAFVSIGDRIILNDNSRFPVDLPVLRPINPCSFPEDSDMASVSVEPGTVGRQPIVDPWPIWDDIERTSQAPNGDKPFLEVIGKDFAKSWTNISMGGRRWRVPTGPGYPADPNVSPNEYLATPQPPPRAIGQDEKAFSVCPAHWEFVLRDNEYHPVVVPAALSSVGRFGADTASPGEPFLTPEQGTAGGVSPWSQSGPPESWIFDPKNYAVLNKPSPWVADRHEGLTLKKQVPPDVFPVPGSVLITRVRPQPNSVDRFDEINVRFHPITALPVGASVRQEEPKRNPNAENIPPGADGLFFPQWIDNSLFREEKRVSVRKPKLSSQEGSDLASLPPPYEPSGVVQQPPWPFQPFEQAQNVGPAPPSLLRPRYYFGHGSHSVNQYMDRFTPPGPPSEMSERSLHSDISERDLEEEEVALWRRKIVYDEAD